MKWVASSTAVDTFLEDVEYLWTAAGAAAGVGDKDSYDTTIPVYPTLPDPLEFIRQHVAKSRPCLIRHNDDDNGNNNSNNNNNNHATTTNTKLSWDELQAVWPSNDMTTTLWVDVTPDGHGDCLRQVVVVNDDKDSDEHENDDDDDDRQPQPQSFFVKPLECQMSVPEFREALRRQQQQRQQQPSSSSSSSLSTTHQSTAARESIKNRIFKTTTTTTTSNHPAPPSGKSELTPLPTPTGICYYSRQNDCLRTELQPLWKTVWQPRLQGLMDWAATVFAHNNNNNNGAQAQPDAINLWMGTAQSQSALHKDFYENLFHVSAGCKLFTLVAPAYAPMLTETPVPSGRFVHDGTEWKVQVDYSTADADAAAADDAVARSCSYPSANGNGSDDHNNDKVETVPWITTDIFAQNNNNKKKKKIPYQQVRVRAGETLYLPACWYHHVAQEQESNDDDGVTIGVNFWYDMDFASPLWAYYHLLQQVQVVPDDDEEEEDNHVGNDRVTTEGVALK